MNAEEQSVQVAKINQSELIAGQEEFSVKQHGLLYSGDSEPK